MYGDKRNYPKIDIYVKGENNIFQYVASTTWAKTCKEAKARYAEEKNLPTAHVKTFFAQ